MKRLKDQTESRSVTEVKEGDFVKVGSVWKEIKHNTASGSERTPRHWAVQTTDGCTYGMYNINRYAKAEDLEDV